MANDSGRTRRRKSLSDKQLAILEVIQRVRDGRVVDTVPKTGLVITQSPHAFRVSVLRAAHADHPRPPENSSLLVGLGHRVVTVPGEPGNLHVTTPEERALAHSLTLDRVPTTAPLHLSEGHAS